MKSHKLLSLLFLLLTQVCLGQSNDAGLWTSYKLGGEFHKKLQWSLAPELRLDNNLSEISSYFTDAGLEYKLPGPWEISATYRVGFRNRENYSAFRQRVQLGMGYKFKLNWGDIGLQTRIQENFEKTKTDRDPDFISTWRNKISIKYDQIKKWELGSSFEVFHAKGATSILEWQDWRWTCSAERKLNKRNFVSVGYLIQRNLTSSIPQMDYVVLVAYKMELRKRKSRATEKGESTK